MKGHRLASFAFVAIIASTASARAQAWVGAKGELGIDFDYNFSFSDKVVTDTDDPFEDAGTTGHQLTLGAEYIPIPKLAVAASIPVVMLKYTGDPAMYPHSGGGSYDDGDFHTTLTDLRVGARYAVLEDVVAVAPHLAFSIPVADYETVGNTVAGRHLKMLHLGASIGYMLGVATYVHASYEFTLAEKFDRNSDTERYTQNRSDMAFVVGHKLLDYRLDLNIGANARLSHGGVNFSEFESGELTLAEAEAHDAILNEDVVLVGVGAGYDISNTLTATLGVRVFLEALSQNTLNASVIALGLSWQAL